MKNDYREDGSQSWAGYKDHQEDSPLATLTLTIKVRTEALIAQLRQFEVVVEKVAESFGLLEDLLIDLDGAVTFDRVEPDEEGLIELEASFNGGVPLSAPAIGGAASANSTKPGDAGSTNFRRIRSAPALAARTPRGHCKQPFTA